MIILNGTLCSTDFRKVGLIQSCVNLATQVLCVSILFKVVVEASPQKKGYIIHGHRIDKIQEKYVTHIIIDVMFFLVVDIFVYFWLIFGLIKKKQSILTGWLLFSIMELVITQISTFYFAVYITMTSHSGASVLGLITPILVSLYLTYNVCVIYTVRHHMIQERNATLPSNTTPPSSSNISYPRFRIPHTPYVPSRPEIASYDLQAVISDQSPRYSITPPPYKESES